MRFGFGVLGVVGCGDCFSKHLVGFALEFTNETLLARSA